MFKSLSAASWPLAVSIPSPLSRVMYTCEYSNVSPLDLSLFYMYIGCFDGGKHYILTRSL